MRLLIVDKLPDANVWKLRDIVDEVDYRPDVSADDLAEHTRGANILLVRGTKVSADVIAKADKLELIVRSGSGTENIDLEAASARGIYVTNCPDKNAVAVAELTMGLLIALDRRIPDQVVALRECVWNKEGFAKADGLKGKVFGVVGVGAVGKEVIRRAKAFEMSVVAWSRSLTDEIACQLEVLRAVTIEELVNQSDIVSLHVAYTPETEHLFSAELISKLKPGAVLLNTSRGPVVDTVALAEALKTGKVRAGLDVYENEPEEGKGEFTDALVNVPNWVGTHHIGASTAQAQRATADEATRIIDVYVKTGKVENCVNFAKRTPALYELIIRHYDRIGVLTGILNDLKAARINVQEVHNIIFEGAKAAVARIQLEKPPPLETLDRISSRKDEIINMELVKL